mgnify:CR=1 FL=1
MDRELAKVYDKDTLRIYNYFYKLINQEKAQGYRGTLRDLSSIIKVKVPDLVKGIETLIEDGYLLSEREMLNLNGEVYIKFSFIDE